MARTSNGPKFTTLGRLVVIAFIAICVYGAWYLYRGSQTRGRSDTGNPDADSGAVRAVEPGAAVEIGIAYGTEKRRWLEWAVEEFARADAGRRIKINLIPMGSLEGAHAVLAGDKRIHVWSPASALYKDTFVNEWQVKYNSKPIVREEPLALTPMVFVGWAERHDAFVKKYGGVSMRTVGTALAEKGGWSSIAGKPEWGLFKFGHTHPNESNSGLMTLVLMAYEHSDKSRGLELKDILDLGFQQWMGSIEQAVTGLSNSTGNMMREMVLKGPSAFDVVFVYENVAIDYLKNAEGRWGELRVTYPRLNMWNDNPYYIIDAPWSSSDQRSAAQRFLDFLLTEPVQRQSLVHGFRPANPSVAVRVADSPFVTYQKFGLRVELGQTCEPPKAEVVSNLLASWQRSQGPR